MVNPILLQVGEIRFKSYYGILIDDIMFIDIIYPNVF